MELAIPISSFDTQNIIWGQPKSGHYRRIIPFTYKEDDFEFNNLIISLHPLKIMEIDRMRNKLVLEEPNHVSLLSKLEEYQTHVINELKADPSKWFDDPKINVSVKCPLQIWIKSKILTLYLSPDPSVYTFFTSDGRTTFSESSIQPGDFVRILIKINGISFQMSEDDIWTGKSRMQHQILHIYKLAPIH
jgi:hypothetical protein